MSYMEYAPLVQLQLSSSNGKIERNIIVMESIELFNLHRVIQMCLSASQSETSIATKPYVFKHDNKVIKGRTTKLYRAPATGNGTDVGLVYTYEVGSGGKKDGTFTLKVVDTAEGDATTWVPRCVGGFGGNINLDAINKKLLTRHFGRGGAEKGSRKFPRVFCDARTSNADIMRSYMSCMREPLHGWQSEGWVGRPAVGWE